MTQREANYLKEHFIVAQWCHMNNCPNQLTHCIGLIDGISCTEGLENENEPRSDLYILNTDYETIKDSTANSNLYKQYIELLDDR